MYTKILKVGGLVSAAIVGLFVVALFLLPSSDETDFGETNTPVPIAQPLEEIVKTEVTDLTETPPQQSIMVQSTGPDPEVIQSLNQIQEMLKTMDKRIVSIEDELDLARLEEAAPQELAESDKLSDEEYSAGNLAAQEKQKQWLKDELEPAIMQELD